MIKKREIRNKINSIDNTKKITKAMEMVSISKMRKIRNRMDNGRSYSDIIIKIISHIVSRNLEYHHKYFTKKCTTNKNNGFIIISTDRGLCSNLNTLLFKKMLEIFQKNTDKNISNNLFIVGLKGVNFFKSIANTTIIHSVVNLKDNFVLADIMNIIDVVLESYLLGKIDKLFLSYNQFKSTIVRIPVIIQLLPILKLNFNNDEISNKRWDYIYEPNSKFLLNTILNRYIKFQIYQAILENSVCEQAARMLAMKKATDNSIDLIKTLQINYNKVRQSNITQELTEIISGASAVSLD